jgi:DNA invertase Pin-like site-specific DNA recombinase
MRPQDRKPTLRCAIYTRVSTDSGLEQEFNSLDNQREAAEAYIKSQSHEGWKLIRDRFDDGGYSGGSMDRPALKTLLDEVSAKRIDVIVVYKVDRLTRSLADFAKLVELFGAHGVSFVSVTQSFNTTTSMGRLTLNVLLSFAQFEREVTGERIRDKIAASKKRGIWMGGVVPLGYRVEDRALHVVEEDAEVVRSLFRRYLEAVSVVRLKQQLDAEGFRVPIRIDGAKRSTGGGSFSRGHLYKILSSPIYIGQLRHKGQVHEGLHAAIIDRQIWESVQRQLADHARRRRTKIKSNSDALLAGKLFDDRGNRMSPSHAARGGMRWRYYVSQALLQGRKQDAGSVSRAPAAEIEQRVTEAIRNYLAISERSVVDPNARNPNPGNQTSVNGRALSETFGAQTGLDEHAADLRDAIERVTISRSNISIQLTDGVAAEGKSRTLTVRWTPASATRRREIIQGLGVQETSLRPMRVKARAALVEALGKAYCWLDELLDDPRKNVETIPTRERKSERSIRMTLSLAFLAPDIVKAAIEGRLPRGFGVTRLIDLPMAWSDQWPALGLHAPAAI